MACSCHLPPVNPTHPTDLPACMPPVPLQVRVWQALCVLAPLAPVEQASAGETHASQPASHAATRRASGSAWGLGEESPPVFPPDSCQDDFPSVQRLCCRLA
jgi:hypothetical protein